MHGINTKFAGEQLFVKAAKNFNSNGFVNQQHPKNASCCCHYGQFYINITNIPIKDGVKVEG